MRTRTVRGHEAVRLARDLVALLESNYAAFALIRADERLYRLERGLRGVARNYDEPDPGLERELALCGFCGTYHESDLADPVCGVTS